MKVFEKIIAELSPRWGAERARARALLMHYDAATTTGRGSSWKVSAADADAASGKRDRMAFVARDMVRNSPFALRAQQVISGNVVGDGIIPKIVVPEILKSDKKLRTEGLELVEAHLDTTAIDGEGRQNLYGLQRLAMNAVVDAGEVLIVREQGERAKAGQFNLKLRILEPDYLDTLHDGALSDGGFIHEGIEYSATGERVAYHLYDQHPGSDWFVGYGWRSRSARVPADRVLHIYRQDRPGQMRGVSWFAPVAMTLQDISDYQDAQNVRQKIAACFAGFRRRSEQIQAKDLAELGGTLSPGVIQDIASDEEIFFGDPPEVGGFNDVISVGLRAVAAGMGISYEALTGDLRGVNFSSARMGRMEMDRNISNWQWLMMIPQMLQPIGGWVREEWALARPERARAIGTVSLAWVPPHRILVDPTREIPALTAAVRSGFASRQGVVRQLGHDPERLEEEHKADRQSAINSNLVFDSDPVVTSAAGVTQTEPENDDTDTGADTEEEGNT